MKDMELCPHSTPLLVASSLCTPVAAPWALIRAPCSEKEGKRRNNIRQEREGRMQCSLEQGRLHRVL